MKIREGHVSNSSSTSFMVFNVGDKTVDLVDFVKENEHLVAEFNAGYSESWRVEQLIGDARDLVAENGEHYIMAAGEKRNWVFGDNDGTAIGQVYDYILREGGTSENFKWRFKEYYR